MVKDENSTKEQIEAKVNELNGLNQTLAQQATVANSQSGASGKNKKPKDDDVIDAEVE